MLNIAPKKGWIDYKLMVFEILLGIFITLLVGYMTRQFVEINFYRHFLEDEVNKRTQEVSKTKNMLQTLLNTIPDLIWLKNISGVYLLCNPMFERFFGAKEADIAGKTDYDFVDSKLADFFRKNDLFAAKANRSRSNEEWLTFADDGYSGLFDTIKTPFYDESGQLVGVLGIARDITHRHNTEQSLIKTENLLAEMSRLAHISGWELDLNSGGITTTKEFMDIHDFDPDEPITIEKIKNLFQGKWLDMFNDAIKRASQDGVAYDMIVQIVTPKGNKKWIHAIGTPEAKDGKVFRVNGSVQDITSQKIAQDKIDWLAHYDELTKLPNRTLLNDRANIAIQRARRNNSPLAMLFLDLDNFKNINDTIGHEAGDLILAEVSSRLKSIIRESDTISRQGGDEFIVILSDTTDEGAVKVVKNIDDSISEVFEIGGHRITVTFSIGIAMYPADGANFNELLRAADSAMYSAKHDGRNCYRFFTKKTQEQATRHLKVANALRGAHDRDEFELHYQPQVDIATQELIGAEALLRWKHPVLGVVSPAEFIPIAEETGQIISIGEWVLQTSLNQLKSWLDDGAQPFTMAVNLSTVQFRDPRLLSFIIKMLDEIKISAKYLELELTESAMMNEPLEAIKIMDKLHDRGINMSIDDFGTGYSSLNYLKKFKVYKLKIDQSFIRDIPNDADDMAIVKTIIDMAHSLNMRTIAEGVERSDQLEFLLKNGCDEIQGYYYSKPIPSDEFEAFLRY
jgi:diguanylate cyclase (GGDEF)-like protein/PAS domain S-box-containing protein